MQAVSALTSSGSIGREHRRPAAGCGRACGTARRRRSRSRAASWRPRRRRPRRRSRRCRRPASASAGSATNGVVYVGRLRPVVEMRRGGGRARDAAGQAAVAEHPVDLVGEQHQRGDRRRVVGLVLERVVQRGRQRQELRASSGRSRDLGDPLLRRRAHQREPQPAVGGEALLRREVVDVGVLGVDRQAAGARGGVDQRPARVAEPRWPATGTATPVEVSLCAQPTRSAPGRRSRRGRGRPARP